MGRGGDELVDKTTGGFLISQIKQIQGRIFERLLNEAGIGEFNGAQGRILYVLWQENNLPIVELSKRTGLAKTTLTGMLDRMEKQGHVLRNYDKQDRRQIRITLTEKAKALNEAYNRVSSHMNEIFYADFSDEEILSLEISLNKILQNLRKRE
jgi:DNA-binding MarR family transcriptional regulator